jgi:hypothetical protein
VFGRSGGDGVEILKDEIDEDLLAQALVVAQTGDL